MKKKAKIAARAAAASPAGAGTIVQGGGGGTIAQGGGGGTIAQGGGGGGGVCDLAQ